MTKPRLLITVQKIEKEALKGKRANEHKLYRWLRTLTGIADNIFAVTVAALTGSRAAFATVARRVAEKVRKERNDK